MRATGEQARAAAVLGVIAQALAASAAVLGPVRAALGDEARYELGRRLGVVERLWMATADPARRGAAAADLEAATTAFFSFRPSAAAERLDRAALALEGAAERGGGRALALRSLAVRPAARLVDRSRASLALEVRRFHDAGLLPEAIVIRATIADPSAAPPPMPVRSPARAALRPAAELALAPPLLPARLEVPLAGLDEGVHALEVTIEAIEPRASAPAPGDPAPTAGPPAASLRWVIRIPIAVVDRLDARLAAARRAIAGLERGARRATAEHLLDQAARLAAGDVLEHDLDGARLLARLEALAARAGPLVAADLVGDADLALPGRLGGRDHARVFVPPEAPADRALPVVVALHGMGGSASMWFEAYGAGRAVELAAARGWILLAPGTTLLAPPVERLLDELAAVRPIDRGQVFLLGHSMGAGHAFELAQAEGGALAPAALAALGGGGSVGRGSALARLPILVAPGELDFARRGAERTHAALLERGAREAELWVAPGAEHVTVVPDALPRAFALFDRVAARRRGAF